MARAFAKLDAIRSTVFWWRASAEPLALLADGSVAMTTVLNGRIVDAIAREHRALGIIWDGQRYQLDVFGIVRGTPNKENALDFIRYATGTEALARVAAPDTLRTGAAVVVAARRQSGGTGTITVGAADDVHHGRAVDRSRLVGGSWPRHGGALERLAGTLMARVFFTSHLRALAPEQPLSAPGATVGAALSALFESRPQLRGYVLDEQGRLRKHVCVFADGERLAHDAALDREIRPDTELYVMQALSGG